MNSPRIPVVNARLSLAVAVACAAVFPMAQAEEVLVEEAKWHQVERSLELAEGHPNEIWRLHGIQAYNAGRPEEAAKYFERAAGYADKYAQHRLSLMYWDGEGVRRDHVQAYIWGDLAAERGDKRMLAIREKMWSQLSAEEQTRVAAEGPGLYERYGDPTTQPKLAAAIERFSRERTGSRAGFDGHRLDVAAGGPISGSFGSGPAASSQANTTLAPGGYVVEREMYGEERTDPERYFAAQDAALSAGAVQVQPLEQREDD